MLGCPEARGLGRSLAQCCRHRERQVPVFGVQVFVTNVIGQADDLLVDGQHEFWNRIQARAISHRNEIALIRLNAVAGWGGAGPPCKQTRHNLFRYGKGIIDFNAKVPTVLSIWCGRARAEPPSGCRAPIDQGGLGSPERWVPKCSGPVRCLAIQTETSRAYCLVVMPGRAPRPVNRNSPGLLREFSNSCRAPDGSVVDSNLTGRRFILAHRRRSIAHPFGATSSTLTATTSQPRSLLSIARLNSAKSHVIPSTWSLVRIDQRYVRRSEQEPTGAEIGM